MSDDEGNARNRAYWECHNQKECELISSLAWALGALDVARARERVSGENAPRLDLPDDLGARIAEAAAEMGVHTGWVLQACIELALGSDDNILVAAVERVRDAEYAAREERR